jgi:hypothetical protein
MLKKIAKSKTMIFSLALAIFGAMQANTAVMKGILTPETFGWFVMGVSVITAALRVVTTKPLKDK